MRHTLVLLAAVSLLTASGDRLGTKLAVRAMQIDRRLSLGYQLEMTTRIPLSH